MGHAKVCLCCACANSPVHSGASPCNLLDHWQKLGVIFLQFCLQGLSVIGSYRPSSQWCIWLLEWKLHTQQIVKVLFSKAGRWLSSCLFSTAELSCFFSVFQQCLWQECQRLTSSLYQVPVQASMMGLRRPASRLFDLNFWLVDG